MAIKIDVEAVLSTEKLQELVREAVKAELDERCKSGLGVTHIVVNNSHATEEVSAADLRRYQQQAQGPA